MKIMVMAGTTEGARIISQMAHFEDIYIIATTTTGQGAELARSAGAHEVVGHAMDEKDIKELIKNKKIDVLMDATHPFAQEATRNAIKAADATGIKFMRFERPRINVPRSDLIYHVSSFVEAASQVSEITRGRVFHLAGVMTLSYLTERIDPQRIVARVLPTVYSLKKCRDLGLSAENIIAMQGTFSKDLNRILMEEYDISVMVTKESGAAGGTLPKIDAALELDIPIVMVMRPEVEELKGRAVFSSIDDIFQELIDFKTLYK